MRLKDFDYNIDKSLIAQTPASPRDHSRLMVLERKTKKISHAFFYQLPQFLKKGDVLVLNDTKVFAARVVGQKEKTKGKVEILLISPTNNKIQNFKNWPPTWKIITKSKLTKNQTIIFSKRLKGQVLKHQGYEKIIKFNKSGKELFNEISLAGFPPLPPYIKSESKDKGFLKRKYQTVFAAHVGSIAAPTAGLHFTKRLLKKLSQKGVQVCYITLHVSLGTFQPIKTENIAQHQMEKEFAKVPSKTAKILHQAKKEKRRIIAVGTTTTRTLEGFFRNAPVEKKEGWVDIFIYPPFHFKIINGLITNFHLPKSTPLLLTAAFAGREFLLKAYQEAIKKRYRFYSFGDAMLII